MPFYEKGAVRIHYEEEGSGPPLLIIPGGGLDSSRAFFSKLSPFDPMQEFKDSYRCITMDLRTANSGKSSGPLEIDRPWDSFTDDQLGLMDHLGIDKFLIMGFCIGGPFIWNLLKRSPERVIAAVTAQPSGWRHEKPRLGYESNMAKWGPTICAQRPELNMTMVEAFLNNMYLKRGDFVYTVDRDTVRNCQTPVFVMPDDSPPHPYDIAMEVVSLAPKSKVSIYPWKTSPELIPVAVAQAREFLDRHRPVA